MNIFLIGLLTYCVASRELLPKATAATPRVLREAKPSYVESVLKPHLTRYLVPSKAKPSYV